MFLSVMRCFSPTIITTCRACWSPSPASPAPPCVAGSSGRCTVDYQTVDGNSLWFMPLSPISSPIGVTNIPYVGAVAGVDYTSVSGTLVFDDYEMSKTILIPILYPGINGSGGYTNNTAFGVQLIDN